MITWLIADTCALVREARESDEEEEGRSAERLKGRENRWEERQKPE